MIIILPTTKPQKGTPPPIANVLRKVIIRKFQEIKSTLETQPFRTTALLIPKFKSEGTYELKKVNVKINILYLYSLRFRLLCFYKLNLKVQKIYALF